MTRLYRLDAPSRDIAAALGARAGDDPWSGGYVAPGGFAPVITAGREYVAGPRPTGVLLPARMVPRLWGVLPPPGAEDPARRIAAVRNVDSPFWVGNLRNSEFRCLVPATRVMLWGSGTDYEGRRLQHWFAAAGEPVFAMLGVWKDEDVPAFALITAPAQDAARAVGAQAMPLVLPPGSAARDAWLHGGWDRATEVLKAAQRTPLAEWPQASAG